MDDPRIKEYLNAVGMMQGGVLTPGFDTGPPDDIGRLGEKIKELGLDFQSRLRQLSTISEITKRINEGLTVDEILDHVYDSLSGYLPFDRIGFSLIQDDGKTVRANWAKSKAPVLRLNKGFEAPLEGSTLNQIILSGQPRIIGDLTEYLAKKPHSIATRLITEEGMRSSLTCPLIAFRKPVGFLFFSSMRPMTYEKSHADLYLDVAGEISVIVEKSRLLQELRNLNEVKNTFLGVAAHDLRHPLSTNLGYLRLLLGGMMGDIPEEQADVLKRMESACISMLGLIEDLLDVTVIESGKLDISLLQVDLQSFLRERIEAYSLHARSRNISLELDADERLSQAELDPKKMEQVFNNLLSNAIKFSPPGTRVSVKARVEGGEALISFSDEGPGIAADEVANLFKFFSRTSIRPSSEDKSTGLGLAISKKIVEAHGGRISVKSAPGKGSTFLVSLPAASKDNAFSPRKPVNPL